MRSTGKIAVIVSARTQMQEDQKAKALVNLDARDLYNFWTITMAQRLQHTATSNNSSISTFHLLDALISIAVHEG